MDRVPFLLIVPLFWVIAWTVRGEPIPQTPMNTALFLLVFMVLVSLFATFDISYSLPKVSGVIFGVAFFFAVVRWLISSERLWLGLQIYLIAGGTLAIVGLLGTKWFVKFSGMNAIISRLPLVIRGLPGAEEGFHPNAVAGALVFFLPVQALLLLKGPNYWKLVKLIKNISISSRVQFSIQALIFFLTSAVFLLTQSRGAWLGLALASLAALGWYSHRTRIILIGIIFLCLAGATILSLKHINIMSWVSAQGGSGLAGNIDGRLEIWSRAIYGIQDFPLTGMGMNCFRKIMPVLYPTFLNDPSNDIAHCHNHILQAALDLGIPGLVAYLAIWLIIAYLLIYVFRHTHDMIHKTMACGLGIGLLAHFLFGIQDAIALGAKVGITFWLILALGVGLYNVEKGCKAT